MKRGWWQKVNSATGEQVVLNNTECPSCGSTEFELRDYDLTWHEGNIHCVKCGKFIRRFDFLLQLRGVLKLLKI